MSKVEMENPQSKRIGIMLLLAGLVLCVAGLWLLLSPEQYQATTTIKIETEANDIAKVETGANDIVGLSGGIQQHQDATYFIQNAIELMESEAILTNVAATLNLNSVWGDKFGDGTKLEMRKTLGLLKRRMSVRPILNTQLVTVTMTSEEPEEAAQLANAVAKAYRDYLKSEVERRAWQNIEVMQKRCLQLRDLVRMQQTNLSLLRVQLKIQSEDKSTHPPEERTYWDAKEKLEETSRFLKIVEGKVGAMKADASLPHDMMSPVVDLAQPPKSPVGPNRLLGGVLLIVGFSLSARGYLSLKSVRKGV